MSHALRTLRVHKKIENFADKNSQKKYKRTEKPHKKIIKLPTLSSSSFCFYFSCFMLLMLLAKIFMFILNNICHTLLSILVLRIWVLNQTTFPTGTFPYPRPPLPHLSAWNVLLLLEEASFWSALRLKGLNKTNSFSCVTEVTRGKEKMHWIPNYCSFFHLSSCAIQSLRLFGFNPFTPMRDQDRISPYNINTTSSGQVTRI